MKLRKNVYTLHRWLGLLVSAQLVAWSAGGLVFSLLAIDLVRGERDARPAEAQPIDPARLAVDAAQAVQLAREALGGPVAALTLRDRGLGLRYELRGASGKVLCAVDAQSGQVVERISPEQAAALALRDFRHEATVQRVSLVEEVQERGEYRGKPAPAWRVDLEHPKRPHIYVDAVTGEVLARRNRLWRLFDFFWMLHIMDYRARESFNHPLLTAMSALALARGLSGLGLWGWRGATWARRGAGPSRPASGH